MIKTLFLFGLVLVILYSAQASQSLDSGAQSPQPYFKTISEENLPKTQQPTEFKVNTMSIKCKDICAVTKEERRPTCEIECLQAWTRPIKREMSAEKGLQCRQGCGSCPWGQCCGNGCTCFDVLGVQWCDCPC